MLYDRVMRVIQNRNKRIKCMNSLINARFQRKLRKFYRVSGLRSNIQDLGSRVPGSTCEFSPGSRVSGLIFRVPGLGSRVPPMTRVSSLGSHFSDMPGEIAAFDVSLHQSNWKEIVECEDVNAVYTTFWDKFSQMYDRFFPIKKTKLKSKDLKSPWITLGIK